jgi:PilZ domain-containing protein
MTDHALERERRVHRRRALNAPMWIVVGGARLPVSALNVSIGGALLHASARAVVGTLVRLEAKLAGVRDVVLDAEVVRVEPDVIGLRFRALGQRALEALLETAGVSASPADESPRGIGHLGPEDASGSHGGV